MENKSFVPYAPVENIADAQKRLGIFKIFFWAMFFGNMLAVYLIYYFFYSMGGSLLSGTSAIYIFALILAIPAALFARFSGMMDYVYSLNKKQAWITGILTFFWFTVVCAVLAYSRVVKSEKNYELIHQNS